MISPYSGTVWTHVCKGCGITEKCDVCRLIKVNIYIYKISKKLQNITNEMEIEKIIPTL